MIKLKRFSKNNWGYKSKSYEYPYNKSNFDPNSCYNWLISVGAIPRYSNSNLSIDDYCTEVQYAVESAGIPTSDAERIYDVVFDKLSSKNYNKSKKYIKATFRDEDGEHTHIYEASEWEDVKRTCEGRSDVEPFEVIDEEYVDESETREFGIGRNIRRGIANTSKRIGDWFNNKKDREYKAGVVYLKATKSKNSITYTLDHLGTERAKSPSEANALIKSVIDKINAKNDSKNSSNYKSDKLVFCYPIIKMKAVDADIYEQEIQEEMNDARESNNWMQLLEPNIKTIRS